MKDFDVVVAATVVAAVAAAAVAAAVVAAVAAVAAVSVEAISTEIRVAGGGVLVGLSVDLAAVVVAAVAADGDVRRRRTSCKEGLGNKETCELALCLFV